MTLSRFWLLVLTKVRLNLKSEASKSYLNYVWWVLEPALFVAVFYVVFGVLLERGSPNFVAFLVCGKIPFLWYSRTVSNSSGSIRDGRGLISQVYIPKVFFPIVVMLQDAVKQAFVFALLLVFLVFYGVEPSWMWLQLPLVILAQALFILASGLVAAAIVPVIPDFRYIISTGLMLLLFGSGTFYSYREVIKPEYQELFLMNPMAALIKNYRQVLLENSVADFDRLIVISVCCIGVALVVTFVLDRYHGRYSKLVLQ